MQSACLEKGSNVNFSFIVGTFSLYLVVILLDPITKKKDVTKKKTLQQKKPKQVFYPFRLHLAEMMQVIREIETQSKTNLLKKN